MHIVQSGLGLAFVNIFFKFCVHTVISYCSFSVNARRYSVVFSLHINLWFYPLNIKSCVRRTKRKIM